MSRFIPPAEKILLARKLIQKARELPSPASLGKKDRAYLARVEDLLRKARALVRFIPRSPRATAEMKEQAKQILEEADQAEREIMHSGAE